MHRYLNLYTIERTRAYCTHIIIIIYVQLGIVLVIIHVNVVVSCVSLAMHVTCTCQCISVYIDDAVNNAGLMYNYSSRQAKHVYDNEHEICRGVRTEDANTFYCDCTTCILCCASTLVHQCASVLVRP